MKQSRRCQAYGALVASVVTCLTLSQVFIFENQVGYLASTLACAAENADCDSNNNYYSQSSSDEYQSALEALSWLMSVLVISEAIGMYTGPHIHDYIAKLQRSMNDHSKTSLLCKLHPSQWTLVIGASIMLIGQIMVIWSLTSIWLLMLTYGLCLGFGSAVGFMEAVSVVGSWFPSSQLAMLCPVAAFVIAPFLWDPVQTMLANPRNLRMDPDTGFMYSSQVRSNLPSMYLSSAIIWFAMQLISLAWFQQAPPQESSSEHTTDSSFKSDDRSNLLLKNDPILINEGGLSSSSSSKNKNHDSLSERLPSSIAGYGSTDHSNADTNHFNLDPPSHSIKSLTVSEAMKTAQFWQLSLISFSNLFTLYWLISTWKVFADQQLDLDNDQFLSRVGSMSAVSGAVGRLFWSALYDSPWLRGNIRWTYGVKQLIFSVGIIGVYFSRSLAITFHISVRLLFALLMCVTFSGVAGVYVFFPSIVRRTFGNRHCDKILGMLFSLEAPGMILSSLLYVAIPGLISWLTAQIIVGAVSLLGFALIWRYRVRLTNESSIETS